ncbi:hypothetical protein [Kineobactrum salinum]|uniref:Uncharacterized protein n=1 Tax=Kineobactrum salinum TaxID=2708301 RepID=A0A6C0U060_9GAMM|nr:hypothetical protein [Kineobactrum salinum]QIB65396.1 hypothetical protein G3T16_08270 [Kineobactrum salinum]
MSSDSKWDAESKPTMQPEVIWITGASSGIGQALALRLTGLWQRRIAPAMARSSPASSTTAIRDNKT